MSKIIILFITLSFFSVCKVYSQKNLFQGIIIYDMDYSDKTGQMDEVQSEQYLGNEQKYFIRESQYKSVMNGLLNVTQLYTGKDTLYSTIKGTDTILYIDTKFQKEKVISSIIKKNQLSVLGYNCNSLELTTSDGIIKYYFNEALRIDKDLYVNHKKGFWYFCLDKTNGALPIKCVTETSDFKLIITAKKIDIKDLDDSDFELPKNLPIIKSSE